MTGPVTSIQASVQHIFHCLPAHAVIQALERELEAAGEEPHTAPVAELHRPMRIELLDVSYRHASEDRGEAGVSGLSLIIEPGELIGITGPSGAGKTTFADILVGLYPPQQGQVLIGGEPLAGGRLEAWRNWLSYVSQDPFLFHDSIRANLLWARADAEEAELWRVLGLAGADTLVERIGLDTVVGERGGLLSGGERQRIALARALLRRPVFLLLDEATNAIDIDSEAAILARLAADPNRPTIVMIAHRESSLALCERRVELRDGRIVHG
jgi:ATP-binding cassette subfamily C protein